MFLKDTKDDLDFNYLENYKANLACSPSTCFNVFMNLIISCFVPESPAVKED